MTPITASTGRISAYGTAAWSARLPKLRRRRDVPKSVPAAALLLDSSTGYDWFSTDAMLSLADEAACWIDSLPLRICASMLRRMLPFSTSTQCLALGTNQLREAARSLTLAPSRLVAFGMLPFACSDLSEDVLVKALIQSAASALFGLLAGTARSEPPRKPGSAWPLTWPGITNCAVAALYFAPTQQVNQLCPTIDAAPPCAYTSYGLGWASSVVLLAREVARKKFL